MPRLNLDELLPPDTWGRLVVGKLALFVVVLILFYFVWLAVRQAVVAHAEGRDPDGTITGRRVRIAGGIVGALGLLLAAQAAGAFGPVNAVSGLAAGLGHAVVALTYVAFGALLALGLVVAFAGREAALSVIVARYLRGNAAGRRNLPKTGEHVTIGDVSGELAHVSLAHLHIRQATGDEVLVPAYWLLTDKVIQGGPKAPEASEAPPAPQPAPRRSIFDQ